MRRAEAEANEGMAVRLLRTIETGTRHYSYADFFRQMEGAGYIVIPAHRPDIRHNIVRPLGPHTTQTDLLQDRQFFMDFGNKISPALYPPALSPNGRKGAKAMD